MTRLALLALALAVGCADGVADSADPVSQCRAALDVLNASPTVDQEKEALEAIWRGSRSPDGAGPGAYGLGFGVADADGQPVPLDVDWTERMATVRLSACDTTVTFRPADPGNLYVLMLE